MRLPIRTIAAIRDLDVGVGRAVAVMGCAGRRGGSIGVDADVNRGSHLLWRMLSACDRAGVAVAAARMNALVVGRLWSGRAALG